MITLVLLKTLSRSSRFSLTTLGLDKAEKNGAAVGLTYGARHAAPTASTATSKLLMCAQSDADTQFSNQCAIALRTFLTEIGKQASTLANQHTQAPE